MYCIIIVVWLYGWILLECENVCVWFVKFYLVSCWCSLLWCCLFFRPEWSRLRSRRWREHHSVTSDFSSLCKPLVTAWWLGQSVHNHHKTYVFQNGFFLHEWIAKRVSVQSLWKVPDCHEPNKTALSRYWEVKVILSPRTSCVCCTICLSPFYLACLSELS